MHSVVVRCPAILLLISSFYFAPSVFIVAFLLLLRPNLQYP
jgi:hypothetical protein